MVSDSPGKNLLLIRHSAVQRSQETPSREWPLSDDGRSRTRQFAPQLIPYNLTRIFTSEEPKARETGQIIANELGLPWQTAPDLQEHSRENAPFFISQEGFETAVARFFNNPDQLVFGNETANQALERFDTAVHRLITDYPEDTLAIVTHGTILTLFVTHYNTQIDPLTFWQNLSLPCKIILSLPTLTLLETNLLP